MPRHARIKGQSGVYHVMLRGINRQELFFDDDDMNKMLAVLAECTEITKARIHAYCFMVNHMHMLLQTGIDEIPNSETLAQVMKRIEVRYAVYFNNKYGRIGTAFQERFRSEPVDNDIYFLTALRYIHRNPVKAGFVQTPDKYRWSSYQAYTGEPGFVYTEKGLAMLGSEFESFMNVNYDDSHTGVSEDMQKMTDWGLSLKIEETLDLPASLVYLLGHESQRNALHIIAGMDGASERQISRVTGLHTSVVSREKLCEQRDSPPTRSPLARALGLHSFS